MNLWKERLWEGEQPDANGAKSKQVRFCGSQDAPAHPRQEWLWLSRPSRLLHSPSELTAGQPSIPTPPGGSEPESIVKFSCQHPVAGREGCVEWAWAGSWLHGSGEGVGPALDFWPRAEHSGRASPPEASLDKEEGLPCLCQDSVPRAWELGRSRFLLYTHSIFKLWQGYIT